MNPWRSYETIAANGRLLLRSGAAVGLAISLSSCGLWQDLTGTVEEAVEQPAAAPQAATPQAAAPQAAAPAKPAAPPPPPLPFDEAFTAAANKLLANANLAGSPADASGRHPLVIDPLVDGVTGVQYNTTRSMEAEIVELARGSYPQYDIRKFNADNVSQNPLVLVGTFTRSMPAARPQAPARLSASAWSSPTSPRV